MAMPFDADVRARMLRRLDWRFLLPDPQLKRIGYVGPGNTLLLRALQAHADAVCFPLREACTGLDLLVAESTGAGRIARASTSLTPDGWVYWELGPLDLWRLRRPRRMAAQGIAPVATYWHYRGFEDCRWVVPLDREDSVKALLARRFEETLSARALSSVSRVISSSSLVRRLVATSMVMRRGTA